jgi:exodeoxyribonuclease VII large subunit
MNSNQDRLFKRVLKESQKPKEERVFSVNDYLDLLNKGLRKTEVKIKGEVSSLNINNRYLFFTLKDQEAESVITCFMGRTNYDISGVDLEIGMEIIVQGYPKVYKPRGSFSFQAQTVELVGEGALKKAYDKLKKKLKDEGIFDEERKRELPLFPKKIGVITSLRGGTVIHDFENNLGKFGFQIKAIDARVEGKQAVKSILDAMEIMKNKDIDILVIMRGGGSLESLQSFDNEILVRAVVDYPVPVLSGIGHHEDVTLVAMASDFMASTPNGAAEKISDSWKRARDKVLIREKEILGFYSNLLFKTKNEINYFSNKISKKFKGIFENFRKLESSFLSSYQNFEYSLEKIKKDIKDSIKRIFNNFSRSLKNIDENIKRDKKVILINDPNRNLTLGYSIVSMDGKIIKSIKTVKKDDEIDIKVSDGKIKSKVKEIKK